MLLAYLRDGLSDLRLYDSILGVERWFFLFITVSPVRLFLLYIWENGL
jgi:hypothetical protein